jgi:sugar (pentulose or hexulose) kinase
MEGVAFGLKHNLDEIEATGTVVSEPMTIAEGGAKNPLWRQIVADVLGKHLNYVGDLGGAEVGAAVLAGVGTGVFTDFSVARKSPRESEQVLPERKNTELYAKVYPVFRDLYVRVAPLFSGPA